MNFFKSQDIARKNTSKLVVLFIIAVISLIIMTNLLLMFAFGFIEPERFNSMTALQAMDQAFDWEVFIGVSFIVIAVVSLGSLYKISALSGGGARVAEMMDAELIIDGTGDLNRQKILNVVEEMAIASGTPVPPVYLLNEDSINAFAAGYTPSDAVIGITRGAIEKLSREQLQGVIAHEFSHIFNGDMRLNIRLIGMLHGIMLLGIIGYYILRGSSRSTRSKNSGGIVFLGLGLVVIGYAGTFFGNLIKAAVSRQREYLADASAVQFTRNPDGIAGALKRIGGNSSGSLIENPHGTEISHALFSEGIKSYFGSLYATHPPLEKRIRNIQPDWDGEFDFSLTGQAEAEAAASTAATEHEGQAKSATAMAAIAAAMTSESLMQQIGQPSSTHLEYAHRLTREMPAVLKTAVHEPYAARAAIYFLLLDSNPTIRQKQLHHLQQHADAGVYNEVLKIIEHAPLLDTRYRLPLVDLALSTLRQLSKQQYLLFRRNLDALIKTDHQISLFEWSIQKIVMRHLDYIFMKNPEKKHGRLSLKQTREACEILLALLAYTGKQQGINAARAFEIASNEFSDMKLTMPEKNRLNLETLNQSLDRLARLKPLQKPQVLKACAACITADQHITAIETELFRAVADTLDCPMPPLQIFD